MNVMIELGERLKEARERKGVTLEEVSRRIKVSARTLEALEAGDKAELPHVVYAKGFVKSYALELKLDPEELGGMVDEAYADDVDESEQEAVVPSVTVKQKKSPVAVLAVVVLLLFAVGGAAWFFLGKDSSVVKGILPDSSVTSGAAVTAPADKAADDAPAASGGKAGNVAPESVDADKSVEALSEASVKDAENAVTDAKKAAGSVEKEAVADAEQKALEAQKALDTAASEATNALESAKQAEAKPSALATPPDVVSAPEKNVAKPVVKAKKAVKDAAASVKKTGVVKTTGSQSVAGAPTQVVQLVAKGDCWIQAWGTDFEKKDLYLRKGQKFFFHFPKELNVKLGNSGVIDVMLNGKPYSFDSGEGKVRTLLFPAKQ